MLSRYLAVKYSAADITCSSTASKHCVDVVETVSGSGQSSDTYGTANSLNHLSDRIGSETAGAACGVARSDLVPREVI